MHGNSQSRRFLLTINNPQDKSISFETIKATMRTLRSVVYYCMSSEVGENGTSHIHLFISSASPIRFSTIKKRFPTAHIDKCIGTAAENRAYVSKSGKWVGTAKGETSNGDFFEWGELPTEQQGRRNDLTELYQQIKAGATDVELLEYNPKNLRLLNYIERTRQALVKEKVKKEFRSITTTYIFGATGVGKTRSIFDQYGYEGVFRVTDYTNPFDHYSGEKVILFDEYASGFKLNLFLTYLEGYPLELPCRYANKWALYTEVYIISNRPLTEQYKSEQVNTPETWEAFLRRLTAVVEFLPNGKKTYYKITDDYQIIPDDEIGCFGAN